MSRATNSATPWPFYSPAGFAGRSLEASSCDARARARRGGKIYLAPVSARACATEVRVPIATGAGTPCTLGRRCHKGRIAGDGRHDQPQRWRWPCPLLGIPNDRVGQGEPLGELALAQLKVPEAQPEQVASKTVLSKVGIEYLCRHIRTHRFSSLRIGRLGNLQPATGENSRNKLSKAIVSAEREPCFQAFRLPAGAPGLVPPCMRHRFRP